VKRGERNGTRSGWLSKYGKGGLVREVEKYVAAYRNRTDT
jgi:hypothetical protein